MGYDQATWYTLIWYLVDGWPTPLKNMKVSWDDYSQYMEKITEMFQTTNQVFQFKCGNLLQSP